MTYAETLQWMFARLPNYQERGASAYSGKLGPIRAFTATLKNPQERFKSIHVAGTNGKGSSSHMLASILQEAGYTIGLYTSPHLLDFRERIRVNGTPVSEDFVISFVKAQQAGIEALGLSFFELTVGMAFSYFEAQQVDIAVVEVGLGGRLDATNIIVPEVSLITNIGMDHMEFLGNELSLIAREKAGIIKEGVPVIISETQEEIEAIFREVAASRQAPIRFADQEPWPEYELSLLGAYQYKNLKGVLAVFQALKGYPVSEDHIKAGLQRVQENTGLLGRWQVLQENPRVLCDTAHNREALEPVLTQLAQQPFKSLRIVLSFVKGKPLDQILPLFPLHASYYIAPLQISRGVDADALVEAMEKQGLPFVLFDSIPKALEAALSEADPRDLIFVGGSTFTVAEVLA